MLDARPLSGLLRSADDLLTAVRGRKDDKALSDELLGEIAGFCPGQLGKYIGPSRAKCPTLASLYLLLGALGCGLVLVEDPEATARMAKRWERRNTDRARDNGRVSKVAIERATPAVLAEIGRRGGTARWAKATPEQRREHSELMHLGKSLKVLARKQSDGLTEVETA